MKRKRLPESVWAELRTAFAAGCGLRELARNAGIPPTTVLSRARREGWTAGVQRAKALAVSREPGTALLAQPADAAAQSLASHSERTRMALARSATKASEHAAQQPAEAILKLAKPLRDVSAIADTVHGWRQTGLQIGVSVNLSVLAAEVG